jgi:hypothetical protein
VFANRSASDRLGGKTKSRWDVMMVPMQHTHASVW